MDRDSVEYEVCPTLLQHGQHWEANTRPSNLESNALSTWLHASTWYNILPTGKFPSLEKTCLKLMFLHLVTGLVLTECLWLIRTSCSCREESAEILHRQDCTDSAIKTAPLITIDEHSAICVVSKSHFQYISIISAYKFYYFTHFIWKSQRSWSTQVRVTLHISWLHFIVNANNISEVFWQFTSFWLTVDGSTYCDNVTWSLYWVASCKVRM